MIVITFALRAESSRLVARLSESKSSRKILVLHTGVGQERARATIENFLTHSRPDLVISSGFAGGIRERLRCADIVLGENFSDPQLLSAAQRLLGASATSGKLMTSDAIIDSVARRNEIAKSGDADAVDMETEAIFAACASHGIRILSLRVISDSVHEPMPLPPEILFDLERQKTNLPGLSRYLLTHPSAIPRLLAFSRRISRARKNLTAALLQIIAGDLPFSA